MTKEFRKMHQFIVFSANTPVQYAYSEFMKNEDKYLSLGRFYEQKRNVLINELSGTNYTLKKCSGTYFQLLDYSKISNKPDIEFSEYLTKKVGVAVIPLSPFFNDRENRHLVRVCFAKSELVLKQAAQKLKSINTL